MDNTCRVHNCYRTAVRPIIVWSKMLNKLVEVGVCDKH